MYRIFDIYLDSAQILPELPECGSDALVGRDIAFEAFKYEPDSIRDVDWFHQWESLRGESVIRAGRDREGYWLTFPELVNFRIQQGGRTLLAYVYPGVPDSTVRHLLLDQVIPRCLGQKGRLILHAGAVVLPNQKAIGIIGGTGWGKSTLVSAFLERNGRLLTDDCLLITFAGDRVFGIPNYSGVRLYRDSARAVLGGHYPLLEMAHYSSKQRVRFDTRREVESSSEVQLQAMFLLNDPCNPAAGDEVSITRAGGVREMMTLVRQTFVLDVADRALMVRQFRHCAAMIDSGVPFFNLAYPRDFGALEEVCKRIIDTCQTW